MLTEVDAEAPHVLLDLLFMAHSKGESRMVQRILETVWEQETRGPCGENTDTPEVMRRVNSPMTMNNASMIDLLCQASFRGKKSLVQQILKFYDATIALDQSHHSYIPLVQQVDRIRKKTALMYACEEGHVHIAQILLDSHANVDEQDYAGWTALMLACYGGYKSVVSILIDFKANIEIEDGEGMTAFMIACRQGHFDIVELFLEQETDLLTPCTRKSQKTALMFASENGHCSIVQALLSHYQNGLGTSDVVNRVDIDGWTPVMMASLHDHIQVFRLLYEYGANMNITSKQGQTAYNVAGPGIRTFLHIRSQFARACKVGDEKVIESLLTDLSSLLLPPWSLSVDDFINDNDVDKLEDNHWVSACGKTPLIVACRYGISIKFVDKLIQLGSEINRVDSKGKSPLMHASQMGHSEIVQLLIERNANGSLRDNEGRTCTQYAQEKNHIETVRLLEQNKSLHASDVTHSLSKKQPELPNASNNTHSSHTKQPQSPNAFNNNHYSHIKQPKDANENDNARYLDMKQPDHANESDNAQSLDMKHPEHANESDIAHSLHKKKHERFVCSSFCAVM